MQSSNITSLCQYRSVSSQTVLQSAKYIKATIKSSKKYKNMIKMIKIVPDTNSNNDTPFNFLLCWPVIPL